MRRHVARGSTTEPTGRVLRAVGTSGLLDRRHGILERTASSKVLSAADTALDLLVLELVLHAALLAASLLGLDRLRLPVHAGSEDDVLADGGGVERWAGRVALFQPELAPASTLRHLGVHMLSDHGGFDAAGDLHFLAVVVEAVGDDRLGSVLVRSHLLRGERGGVIELLVVGPVGAARFFNLVRKCAAEVVLLGYSLSKSRHVVGCGDLGLLMNFWISKGKSVVDLFKENNTCGACGCAIT